MAIVPTSEKTSKLKRQSRDADRRKILAQKKQGKQFENKGQGVIPEAVWQNLPGKKEGEQNG